MITATIIQYIKDKALEIEQIQEVIMHPEGADVIEVVDEQIVYKGTRLTKFPALVIMKDTFTSEFLDTGSNHRQLNFKAWVVVPCENKESQDIWERVLPNAVDAVLEKFDKNWDFGVTEENQRIWCRMASGLQGYTPEPSGRLAWEELSMVVRHSVDAQASS